MDGNKWQGLLDQLSETTSGPFFFIKEGKTRVRLVPQKETSDHFFVETTRVFRGKTRSRYIILGVVAGVSTQELSDEWKTKVAPIVVPKTVVKSILQLLAEGYDLLGPEGNGITIIRDGKGIDTSYNVLPSPKPIPIPDGLTYPDSTLEELSQEFYQSSLERDQGRSGEESQEPKEEKQTEESSGEDW